jgi:hypothetical protein
MINLFAAILCFIGAISSGGAVGKQLAYKNYRLAIIGIVLMVLCVIGVGWNVYYVAEWIKQ